MKHRHFLFLSAIGSLSFGIMLFFIPQMGAEIFGMRTSPDNQSLLRGMGGLIIGSGIMNFLFRNADDKNILSKIFLTNIYTHLLGILADFWGLYDGVLTPAGILPVEITHLIIGGGSFIFRVMIKTDKFSKSA